MRVKDKIINELDLFKEKELSEIMDFFEFLKTKHSISDITFANEEIYRKTYKRKPALSILKFLGNLSY